MQRIIVLGASLIQVGEIHAEPPFVVVFLNEDNVRKPVRIVHFSD